MDIPLKVQFHYKKSTHFRVIHADGVWGGLTPEMNVFLGFYSQRPPIPEMTVHPISAEGVLGDEIKDASIGKSGLVREIEAGIVMNESAIASLIQWLEEKQQALKHIHEIKSKANDSNATDSTASA